MKCYNCGCTLSDDNFCNACGADVSLYKKVIHLANAYYNDGLKKAQVRDLTGAVSSLKQSLKCNRNHILARNLLGLVYFEMGDAVAALSEWVISKSIRPKRNVAEKYIDDIQNNPAKLSALSQAIKKYNQSLAYCQQDSKDLAIIQLKRVVQLNPNYLVAYNLLGLLYLDAGEWAKAEKVLEKALKIDTNNTLALSYIAEARERMSEKDGGGSAGKKKAAKMSLPDDVIAYRSGNETIIQPLNTKERAGSQTFINILIGLALGVAASWFLIIPARMQANSSSNSQQLKDVSTQLTNKSADMDELNQQITSLEAQASDLRMQLEEFTGNTGIMQDYNLLLKAAEQYISNSDDVLTTAGYLEQIDAVSVNAVNGMVSVSGNNVSNEFMSLYKYLKDDVSAKAVAQYLETGIKNYNNGGYTDAIANLTSAYELDPTSDKALYYLAQSYLKSDDKDTATRLFNELINNFPSSQYKNRAQRFLDNGTVDSSPASTGDANAQQQALAEQQAAAAAAAAALQQQQQQAAAAAAAAAALQQQQQQQQAIGQ